MDNLSGQVPHWSALSQSGQFHLRFITDQRIASRGWIASFSFSKYIYLQTSDVSNYQEDYIYQYFFSIHRNFEP